MPRVSRKLNPQLLNSKDAFDALTRVTRTIEQTQVLEDMAHLLNKTLYYAGRQDKTRNIEPLTEFMQWPPH